MKSGFNLLFVDEDLLVVEKKAGLLTLADRHQKQLPNLRDLLSEKYGEMFVVHRLDKDTSGILIFARNAAAHRSLSMQFEHRSIETKVSRPCNPEILMVHHYHSSCPYCV